MIEFNPDGSMKLPGYVAEQKKKNEIRLKQHKCIHIKREIVSFSAPKKCLLKITLSDVFKDNQFVQNIYNYFKEKASVPAKIKKINEKQFEVEIGTDFRRCTDCNSLINRYKEFLDGNVIEEKGSCTFEGSKRNFCYEDYFD